LNANNGNGGLDTIAETTTMTTNGGGGGGWDSGTRQLGAGSFMGSYGPLLRSMVNPKAPGSLNITSNIG